MNGSEILPRRIIAYLLDLLFIGIIGLAVSTFLTLLAILSFGLLSVLFIIVPAIGVLYAAVMIGGPASATIGMRLVALEVRRTDGGRPGFLQALIFTLLFYATVGLTSWLILLLALVLPGNRALHDVLSGLIIVRADQRYIP